MNFITTILAVLIALIIFTGVLWLIFRNYETQIINGIIRNIINGVRNRIN